MSRNVTIAGASYTGVPAIDVALTAGGLARFLDTSGATATAADIAKGKTAGVNGVMVEGTNTGGGGGLPTGISAINFGSITINSDFTTSRQTFQHNLGVAPDMIMVYATANIASVNSMLLCIRGNGILGYRGSAYTSHALYHANSSTTVSYNNSNSTTYGVSNMTSTSFQLASISSSYYWRKGTYKYIAIKFS